jgi:GxxExxY protein
MNENDISHHVVDCAIEVHRTLGGPGLLESIYEEALVWELARKSHQGVEQGPLGLA